MIAHGKDIKVFTGNSNPQLAKDICKELGIPLGSSEVGAFSDGENFASIYETVRGSAKPSLGTPSPPSWWPT